MKNKEDTVSQDYKEKFNIGYQYSKTYPEVSLRILEQNRSKTNLDNAISGLLAGMKESIDGSERERESRVNDLNNIRNLDEKENNRDIDR